ncbi:MAG: hypothetical protein ACC628_24800, partial [Pirellulaceae bacterium]
MRRISTISSGLVLALACSVSGREWEVRYAAFPNATEEPQDPGWLPDWKVDIEDMERPVIHMDDNEAGSAMGHSLFGTVLEPFARASRPLYVQLELQMSCSCEDRAGFMCVYILSQEAWEKLPTEPGTRTPLPRFRPNECFAKSEFRPPGGEDITEWRAWQSANLAA